NAVEASSQGSKVVVALDEIKNENRILIHNRGIVPDEIKDSFFENHTTFGKGEREGVGTYISKLIVMIMGGNISFTSDDSSGTTLTITFPKEYNRAEQLQELGINEKNQNDSFRILVVDDYAMMRRLIAGFLKDVGYRNVVKLESADEAVKYLQTETVNLIVSDYDMPGMNGLEFLKYVRNHSKLSKTPFVMITGRSDQHIVTSALGLGVNQYIVKPFTAEILEKKLRRVFECSLVD
ncbi:MAG: hybrid sensor histidine kinase/response regulator, partial [Desulfamplus sp.]|nr:hybrid sensor histidine kinase/response regulator [Desulfamplus sp.]